MVECGELTSPNEAKLLEQKGTCSHGQLADSIDPSIFITHGPLPVNVVERRRSSIDRSASHPWLHESFGCLQARTKVEKTHGLDEANLSITPSQAVIVTYILSKRVYHTYTYRDPFFSTLPSSWVTISTNSIYVFE